MTGPTTHPSPDEGDETLRLQIMGPLRLWRGKKELDGGPRQQRCLLALLLAREGRPVNTNELVDLIWGADAPASAVNVIHKYVGTLRRLLEPDRRLRTSGTYLLRHGNGYRFAAGQTALDLVMFRRHVTEARSSQARGELDQALDHYLDALRLCHGPAGDALADSAAAAATFASIDGEFFDAVTAAADVAVQVRRPTRMVAPLRLAAQMSQLNEPVQASLVATLAASGHQAEALSVYRAIRMRLADELGIDPGHDLQAAQRRALTQETMPPAGLEAPVPVPARPIPLVRPAQLPPDLPLFVGRDAELSALHHLFNGMRDAGRTSPLVIAMDGMGGVGKSTLAARFAHLVSDDFTDGQLYLDLQGHLGEDESVPAGEALRSLLYALGVPASDVPDTFDARVGMYRSLTASRQVLVLLDNVRDASQVRPLLPNSSASLVLITSRRSLVGLAAFDGAHLLWVDLPALPDARALLERRLAGLPARTPDAGGDARIVDEIIELCGRLPLALAILAARIAARPRLSLATVAAELRNGARRLEAFPGGRGLSDPRTAFSWSYQQLSSGAARLFRLLSVALAPGATAEACVSLSGHRADDTRAELAELAEAALVTEHENGRFTSHPLVKAYAEELFQAEESVTEREAALTRLLQYYLHSSFNAQVALKPNRTPIAPPPALPGVVPARSATYDEAIAWFAGQREELKDAVRLAADAGFGIIPWQLAITMQQYLQWAGYFQDWEDTMRVALRAARKSHDAVGEAHVLRSLAGARHSFDANEESIALLAEALRIFKDQGMSLEEALVHNNYYRLYRAMGRHDLALERSERALSLFRLLNNRRGETVSLLFIGMSRTSLGRLDESDEALREALKLTRENGSSLEEREIRTAMARNLAENGRIEEAAEQLELSVEMSRQASDSPQLFGTLWQLTDMLISAGDVAGAERALQRARAVLEELQDGGTERMRSALAALAERISQRCHGQARSGFAGLLLSDHSESRPS
ncbi:AfsR/SARP family transcriptional regulator [Paractinoplanes durhamensis]|uniref:SARP family transcriptional regulator n=1 Tax=Paractinoplanes durhamensis TaxID=113563 RepID=A0ABQ3ZD14_9ACTN|nr:BTAD domain-containing putative transcriptional regulator [Actinoplanes durhamensis]GIE07714.1 SARP family transcriptional regulator [Actinoplanes durhamensis]